MGQEEAEGKARLVLAQLGAARVLVQPVVRVLATSWQCWHQHTSNHAADAPLAEPEHII